MDDIKSRWREARNEIQKPSMNADHLISEAKKKKRLVVYFQYGNIAVMTATLVLIAFFFFRVVTLQTVLSQVGIFLMHAGLAIRIIIEIYSVRKSHRIVVEKDLFRITQDMISYYNYRRKVHGPFTIITIALYVLGFYFLSPEFALYINIQWMVLMHLSFLVGAAFLIWQIRKGILREMKDLKALSEIGEELETN